MKGNPYLVQSGVAVSRIAPRHLCASFSKKPNLKLPLWSDEATQKVGMTKWEKY